MYLKTNDEISYVYKIYKYMEDNTGKYAICFILYGDEMKTFSFDNEKERDKLFNLIKSKQYKIIMEGDNYYELLQ